MLQTQQSVLERLKDKRWTRADKLMQFRAILKLHARDKRLQALNAVKLKRKVARRYGALKVDVKTFREIINDTSFGDRRSVHLALLSQKDIKLALRDLEPEQVFEAVCQDVHTKEKQINKMLHVKNKALSKLYELELERSTLLDKSKEDKFHPDDELQNLTKLCAHYLSKCKTALKLQNFYKKISDGLRENSGHYDYVLQSLRIDKSTQQKLIIRLTIKGKIWNQNLQDSRFKYKGLLNDVMQNMKEHERSLEVAREQVQDLWAYAQSVIRIETEEKLIKSNKYQTIDKLLEDQLDDFNKILEVIKSLISVRSYEELLSRIENQVMQKQCLSKQFDYCIKERDSLLYQISHAETVLASLTHSVLSTTGEYKSKKSEILEKIKEQVKKEVECKQTDKYDGKLLVDIKSELQTMLSMLASITIDESLTKNVKNGQTKKKEVKKKEQEMKIIRDQDQSSNDLEDSNRVETDALVLLQQVSRKVGALYAMSRIELTEEIEEKAREMYQTYVADYKSQFLVTQQDKESTNIFIDFDVVDDNVPTRADIKQKSKKLIESVRN